MTNSVLIVDEDVNARIIAETLLRMRGLQVLSASDGTEACDVVRSEGAAVLVLGLPNCDAASVQLLRILRQQFESFPVPTPRIVVLADRCEPEAERDALRSSADVFLRKPFEPAQFIAIVERLILDARPHNDAMEGWAAAPPAPSTNNDEGRQDLHDVVVPSGRRDPADRDRSGRIPGQSPMRPLGSVSP